ncbi:MAG: putative secreted protein, partial [Herbinix sp.]|nr:putative secreted protein [Herbinix sp.]
MVKKRIKRRISFLLIFCIVLTGIKLPFNATATVVNDSESEYVVYNSDDEPSLIITMKKGEITIVGKSHAATSSIRWRTKGFTITRNRINSSDTAKGYTGPGPVSDASGNGYAALMFENAARKDDKKVGDTVTTTITFSASQVEAALKDNFDDITKETTIYLHGIFETYDYDAKTDTKTVRPGKSNIKNWKDIMNAEFWGSNTLGDFKKYFNMEIEFMPAPQPNTLYYYAEDGTKLGSKELASKLPNESVSWTNESTTITKGKKSYELIGYYVTKKNDTKAKKLEEHYLKDGYTLNNIKSGSTKVRLGGMNVFLIYKAAPAITGTPTPTPKVSVTPSPVTPTPVPSATPAPSPTPIEVPESETIAASMNTPEPVGNIRADDRGAEKFTVNLGVPTTESLYTEVTSDNYLMGYELQKKVGIETYSAKVTKTYNLKWQGKDKDGVI